MPRPVNVLFFVPGPVFNQFEVDEFPGFDKSGSSFLYRTLLMNQMEVVKGWGRVAKVFLLLHQFDIGAEGLDELQRFDDPEIIFYESETGDQIISEVAEELLTEQSILVIVNPLVMGLTSNDYSYLTGLADQEDEVVHVTRSANGWVSSFAFNYHEAIQKDSIKELTLPWNRFLKNITSLDARPLVSTSGLVVKSQKDFRSLYDFLSSKESIPACSFEMHDRFTELFVEYKELL